MAGNPRPGSAGSLERVGTWLSRWEWLVQDLDFVLVRHDEAGALGTLCNDQVLGA